MNILKTIAVLCLLGVPAQGAVVGQLDTFQDGTTDNWLTALLGSPNPNPPVNIASGGPAGASDKYMLLTSNGTAGAGGRLAVINVAQWTGNYLTSGIDGITMDLNNFGGTDLDLRLLFASGGPPTDIAVSSTAFHLVAGSGWQHAFFGVGLDSLTAIMGTTQNALSNATELRIFDNPAVDFPGPQVVASLGVDNINAVPEPGVAGLVTAGLLLLAARRRRR
jgi:hypothetical protein